MAGDDARLHRRSGSLADDLSPELGEEEIDAFVELASRSRLEGVRSR